MKHESGIRNLLNAGLTVKEAATQLGITNSYARVIMAKSGIKTPERSRATKARQVMSIAKLMAEGKPDSEIAESVGLSPKYLAQLQLEAGLRKPLKRGRKPGSKSARRPDEVRALLEEGKSVVEVAGVLGVTSNAVYQVCSRNGIKIPKQSRERKQEVGKEIIRLRELGISNDGIAYAVGLNPGLIYTYRPNPKGRPKNDNQKLVVEALRRGESVDEISQSLNLLPGTVIGYGRKNGFSFKRSYVLCGKEGA